MSQDGKYLLWVRAEACAQELESELRLLQRSKNVSSGRIELERRVSEVRALADSLFESAMQEIHREVNQALSRPVRKPYG